MKRVLTILVPIAAAFCAVALTAEPENPNSLIVHEWGTFTSIAGENGSAITWLPWNGPDDLPCFVDRFRNKGKASYAAKVRMETPVLYFYAQRASTVNVSVRFRQGLITEWFPRAAVMPDQYFEEMSKPSFESSIRWNDVKIQPDSTVDFPKERGSSHYYAARNTDAAPLESGTQHEKFLFYRGIGNFDIPLSATVEPDGSISVKNLAAETIPAMFFFENRNRRIRFKAAGKTGDRNIVALPAFDASFDSLGQDLERALTDAGLYAKEAAAMVQTWRDSWFEEGARLLYVVPQNFVDRVLPVEIKPAPATLKRVFVGRVELMTPATMDQIEQAIRNADSAGLERYGRFIEPVRNRIVAKMSVMERRKAESLLQSASSAYFARTSNVCH